MQNFLKRTIGVFVLVCLSTSTSYAEEVTDYAKTQRICACFEKTGTANCQPLSASNTEDAYSRSTTTSDTPATHR